MTSALFAQRELDLATRRYEEARRGHLCPHLEAIRLQDTAEVPDA